MLQRRKKLLRLLRSTDAQAILITNFTNVTYLTGFTGDDSYLLISPDHSLLISDARFEEQIDEECPSLERVIRSRTTSLIDAVAQVVKKAKLSRIAIEGESMSVSLLDSFSSKLPKVAFFPSQGLVEELRLIKDASEIDEIRFAIRCAEKAFGVVRASLQPEMTEKEVVDELERQVRLFGAKRTSFIPIVGVGPRAALPHAPPSDRQIGESNAVLIDWGALGRLYVSDLTRILVTGKISPKLERIYRVVLKANLAGIAAIRPGAVLEDVDKAARRVIEKAGFAKFFNHGLGHGIGLEVHEGVRLSPGQKGVLKAGMVVTVEPGIYLRGWGGVRIEDDVLVTRTGHEVLSTISKKWEDCVIR